MQSPQLDDGAIDEHFVAKIVDRAGGWEIRVFQHFFFVEPHFFSGLEQHQNMAGRARGNELVGDLGAKRTQKIEMADEERQMSIIGDGVERVDFEREVAPVLEKLAHDRSEERRVGKECRFRRSAYEYEHDECGA